MLKNTLALIALLGGLQAHAAESATFTVIGFGVDGASGQSMPAKNSDKMAAAVYQALGGTGSTVELSSDKTTVSIEAQRDNFAMMIGDNTADIKIVKKNKAADVALKGEVAQFLYDSLQIDPSQRTGGALKQVGNIKCAAALVSMGKKNYSCVLADVTALQMENR
ncbi:MAG: hypothetical protein OM95_12280 [Bdellovibrio sp. ArHS]|uniref:hypothetical protein n=1 Tax=Bdellovibrio sp. ArHS TaxID=1569284 RepID=UPI0005837525|nr:hypothetical protein [Bdellovibrio sp. ArHS]KHD87786.1 MAG: hypothetical protein OM95_12280 [Bdellovibrio sp. ArHS]